MSNDITLYFMVGTEAELMKLYPVIINAKSNGFICKIISSGQNNIDNSIFLDLIEENIFVDICGHVPENKTIIEYLRWIISSARKGRKLLTPHFSGKSPKEFLMLIHGDTLTTALGAWLARKCKVNYVHIESGLRSNNFLSPFPEEFDRMYGSLGSIINFCPKEEYANYAAKKFKGKSINLMYNTGIETLYWALNEINKNDDMPPISNEYFLFMLHRQENLKSKTFLREITNSILELSKKIHCVFIYHEQTKYYLENSNLFSFFQESPNITLLPRQSYINFITYVNSCEFVVTDGVGNQQELFYLGKPHLIIRKSIEKDSEGINHNAKLFNGKFSDIQNFFYEYEHFIQKPIIPKVLPSDIIVKELKSYFGI